MKRKNKNEDFSLNDFNAKEFEKKKISWKKSTALLFYLFTNTRCEKCHRKY